MYNGDQRMVILGTCPWWNGNGGLKLRPLTVPSDAELCQLDSQGKKDSRDQERIDIWWKTRVIRVVVNRYLGG